MRDASTGIALLLIAGVMNASFTLPMKFTRNWCWENTWSVWTLWALLILPSAVALLTVPRLATVYAHAGMGNVLLVAACGMGWGIAQVLFGLAVEVIGIALAFSIVLGLSAAMGSLVPLLRLHPEKVMAPAGFGVLAGVLLVVVGVSVCAVAGRKREKATATLARSGVSTSAGLLIAIVSGVAAAAMNFGVAFGQPLINSAQAAGAGPAWSTSAVWVPLLVAAAVPNLLYCAFLMKKNRTAANFRVPGTASYWILAALMAFLWFFSTLLYGVASGKLGELGPLLGWPFFMSLIVIVASMLSVMTGEWKDAGRGPLLIQLTGVGILVIAVIVLSQAGQYV